MRLAGVLEHNQVVSLGNGENRVHVSRRATQVDGQDRFGAWSESRLDLVGVNLKRLPIRVDEHGNCELQHHHVDGGRECIRRDDNLVARADAESVE